MLQEIVLSAIVVQAVANNLCNFLLKAGYGVASKRFGKLFWNEPKKLDDMRPCFYYRISDLHHPFYKKQA